MSHNFLVQVLTGVAVDHVEQLYAQALNGLLEDTVSWINIWDLAWFVDDTLKRMAGHWAAVGATEEPYPRCRKFLQEAH